MTFLDAATVQHWLEETKLTLPTVSSGIDSYVVGTVLGKLSANYDTSTWLDISTTPEIVVTAMAMLAAAAEYRKAYSEDLIDGSGMHWAEWLEATVFGMITDINSGLIQIPGIEVVDSGQGSPTFFPNDFSSIEDPAKFSMNACY